MKRFPMPMAFKMLATGLAIMIAIVAYFAFNPRTPLRPQPAQFAGQAGKKVDTTFLKGGPLQQGLEQAQPEEYLEEDTGTDSPSFDAHDFKVHAGKIVSITLRNHSTVNHQHNWVLVNPGTQDQVQEEAEKVGPTWGWIPQSKNVLAFVPLTQPGQSNTILFRAPEKPGNYPFLCSFPGHGNVMHGTLHVVE